MILYNGYSYNEIEEKNVNLTSKKYPSRKDIFKEQTIIISLSGFDLERSEEGLFKSNVATKNISRLTYDIDSLNKRYNERLNNQFNDFNKSKIYSERDNVRQYAAII